MEQQVTNWVVITGAPSSGKTTLLRYLEGRGYSVRYDVARDVLHHARHWKDVDLPRTVQERILQLRIDQYQQLPQGNLLFLEYGFPDDLVFQAFERIELPDSARFAREYRYKAVFILQPLNFELDGIRDRHRDAQISLDADIKTQYRHLGYDPIEVQAETVEARAQQVLDKLEVSHVPA